MDGDGGLEGVESRGAGEMVGGGRGPSGPVVFRRDL